MSIRTIAAFAVLISAVHLPLHAQAQAGAQPESAPIHAASQPTPLVLGKSIKVPAMTGQKDVFTVAARQGQYFKVEAEQQGADVVVEVKAPDGKSLIQVDSPNGVFGPETACVLAEELGDYSVVISTSLAVQHGAYTLALITLREVEPADRERLQLQEVTSKAVGFLIQSRYADSLEAYRQADAMVGKMAGQSTDVRYQQASDRHEEGQLSVNLGQFPQALEYLTQALALLRSANDRYGEAATLSDIGMVYERLSDYQKSIDFYNQAIALERETDDPALAVSLSNLGNVYQDMGEMQKALDYQQGALVLIRQTGDRDDEAITLGNIGLAYQYLGELQKALDYDNQALPIYREVGDHYREATELNNMGYLYDSAGDTQKAVELYNQALSIERSLGDRDNESSTLNNLGNTYEHLHDYQKALDLLNQALVVVRETGNRNAEASTLGNIGMVYKDQGQLQKALDYFNQALAAHRAVGDRPDEAVALRNIGNVYDRMGEQQKALDLYRQALPIATEVRDPQTEARICWSLMRNRQKEQPVLAIYFGKQAINFLQQMRSNMQGLDQGLQKSFLALNEQLYHDLANLLIDQGRLPEAEQVLELLKQQEYTDYVRGSPSTMLGQLSLTPAERQAEEDYQKSTAQLVTEEQQWTQLKKTTARTPEQEKQYQQLSDELAQANQGMNDYYTRLYKLFGKNGGANKQVADVQGDVAVLRQQIAKMPHTVALYTVVAEDRYSVVVIAGNAPMAGRKYDITEHDLNQKIAAFQQVLRDPLKDPKPLGQELYKILIGPVKSDLDQARAETLVFSLDGALRYIPMAALYDGQHYLVENYNLVAFTPASISHLSDKPQLNDVSAVAMGISRKYEDGLNPLPTVVTELDDIIHDPQVKNANGVLPGTILLNGQFTEKAMEGQLDGQHAIVHIASHFVLKPGDDNASYLLLAGKDTDSAGYHLTVADFRNDPNLRLDNTDLLTLSACDTGVGGAASNGREVDGLATTAQLNGASSVIASLWEVNDESTGELMADFYKRWADGGGKEMKVEALRQAQLDLLSGRIKPSADSGADESAPVSFAHPYYWAPFILMGNWR